MDPPRRCGTVDKVPYRNSMNTAKLCRRRHPSIRSIKVVEVDIWPSPRVPLNQDFAFLVLN